MRKLSKKLIVMITLICTIATFFTGCTSINGNEVAATLDGEEIKADFVNFYLRLQQANYEYSYMSIFGSDMWTTDMTGTGVEYQETVKTSAMTNIQEMLILEKHTSDYDVSLTDEEVAAIDAAAESFMADNDKETIKIMTASKEIVARVLTLYTIQYKMEEAIIADADREVSDEEAAQKTIQYLFFSTADTTDTDGNTVALTDEEKAEIKEKAQGILDLAKVSGDLQAAATEIDDTLTVSTASYGTDDTDVADELKTAGDALAEGDFADLIETDSGFYIVKLQSEFDEEATATRKEEIIAEREQALFDEVYGAWEEESDFVIKEKVLEKISFSKHSVTLYVPETESTEATSDTTGESDTGVEDTSSESTSTVEET